MFNVTADIDAVGMTYDPMGSVFNVADIDAVEMAYVILWAVCLM